MTHQVNFSSPSATASTTLQDTAAPVLVPANPVTHRTDSIVASTQPGIMPISMQGRPRLTPPTLSRTTPAVTNEEKSPVTLSELRYIAAMSTFRSFGEEMISSVATRLESFKLKLQEITTENIQRLKEAAERASESGFWSLLKKIATCLVSALSIVIGAALVSTGGGAFVGGAMIASGILSIANFTFSESGAWDWVAKKLANENEERRKQLAFILPSAVGIASALVGIFGATGSIVLNGFAFMEKAIFIAQAALASFEGATTIGKGCADARLMWARADLSESNAQMTVERHKIEGATNWIDDFIKELGAVRQKTAQFIRLALQSNQTVVQDLHS